MKFKVGDKVRCVVGSPGDRLYYDDIYIISEVSKFPGMVKIVGLGNDWADERFELVATVDWFELNRSVI